MRSSPSHAALISMHAELAPAPRALWTRRVLMTSWPGLGAASVHSTSGLPRWRRLTYCRARRLFLPCLHLHLHGSDERVWTVERRPKVPRGAAGWPLVVCSCELPRVPLRGRVTLPDCCLTLRLRTSTDHFEVDPPFDIRRTFQYRLNPRESHL